MYSTGARTALKLIAWAVALGGGLASLCRAGEASPMCRKWDYCNSPVTVTGTAWQDAYHRLWAAFDGYPTSLSQAYPIDDWRTQPGKQNEPVFVVVDYGRPVAVTRFVHYFNDGATPTAWKDVQVSGSNDNKEWQPVQSFKDLAPDLPQVLPIDQPKAYRYYRVDVRALAEGASALSTLELETYFGTTVGSVAPRQTRVIQSEKCDLVVRLVSSEAALKGGRLRITAPAGSLAGELEAPAPAIPAGGGASATLQVRPMIRGPIPVTIELRSGNRLVDSRSYVLRVQPKLVFQDLSQGGAVVAALGKTQKLSAVVVNSGTSMARRVKVSWMGRSADLGSLAPGRSAGFTLTSAVRPGYSEGVLTASDASGGRTSMRRSIVCPVSGSISVRCGQTSFRLSPTGTRMRMQAGVKGGTSVTGSLSLFVNGQPQALNAVWSDPKSPALAVALSGAVLLVDLRPRVPASPDAALACRVVPDDPRPLSRRRLDVEFRVAVDQPKVMFRPHIDWYTVEHGPNRPQLANGHNSATRMLSIRTDSGSLSMVPDTDNLTWGFTPDDQMTAHFSVPLISDACMPSGRWRPVDESPTRFSIALPVTKGDWWEAYRHVAQDIFKFEQPRQWAMPITQMQMLTSRELMSYRAWSEKYQIVRCLNDDYAFWTFYASVYTIPALYQWYLATDNTTARIKAEKMVDWLLRMQYNEKPMEGAWFTAYHAQPNSNELIGGDFIKNRWLIPHGTGAVAKCLLWYYDVTGRTDKRVLDAARRGCDWLIKTMREDGGWPYAFELDGKAVTQACGAGQIWNTWALWRMYKITGETRYRDAALTSKGFFKREYMDNHRYVGYWEDTVQITRENNKAIRNWEAYEPAIAVQVFSEMGDQALALAAAKDAAAWTWTRVTSTRQYETAYGQTTEQGMCGPSQAQSPMVAVAFHEMYEKTGEKLWSDLSGAVKAVNFCADPDQEYGMVATSGWVLPLSAVTGPPYDNVRPWVAPDAIRGEYGRRLWTGWCTDQFAWLALEWLVREGNLRAPAYVSIDPEKLRGTVFGLPGRIKMPEDKCDVNGIDHYDINWVGYQNDDSYVLLVMNHKEKTRVMVRPHEAHLDVFCRPPTALIGSGRSYVKAKVARNGVQYAVDIPENGNAILIWDRIK